MWLFVAYHKSFFIWLMVLFHDFPRDQIRAATQIAGNNLIEITIPWPHVEKQIDGIKKNFLALHDFQGPSV